MLKYSKTRVLIVGAGAIGQVYGAHLQKGGDLVSVLIRPHHEKQAKEGFTLHRLGLAGKRANYELFKPDRVMTSIEQVPGEIWNAVWFCVPTPVMREPWVRKLLGYVRGASIVVTGLADVEYLKTMVPEETIVKFLVSLVSYPGPLEGEDFWPPGMVYYFPPLSPSAFEGQKDRAMACVNELARGGMPSAWGEDVVFKSQAASALLMPFVLGMRCENWSLAQLRESKTLDLVLGGYRELLALAQRQHNVEKRPHGALNRLLDSGKGNDVFKFGLKLTPKVVPFPFDAYMQFHFTKVQTQTQEMICTWLLSAGQLGIQTPHLQALYGHWAGLVGAQPFVPPAGASQQFPTAGSQQFNNGQPGGSQQFPTAGSQQFNSGQPGGSQQFPTAGSGQFPTTGPGRIPASTSSVHKVDPHGQPAGIIDPTARFESDRYRIGPTGDVSTTATAPPPFDPTERVESNHYHISAAGDVSTNRAAPPPFDPTERVDSSHYQIEPPLNPTRPVHVNDLHPERVDKTEPVLSEHYAFSNQAPVDKTDQVNAAHYQAQMGHSSPDESVQFRTFADRAGLEDATDVGLEEPTDPGLGEPTE